MRPWVRRFGDPAARLLGVSLGTLPADLARAFFRRVYWFHKAASLQEAGNESMIEYPARIVGGKYIRIGASFWAGPGLTLEAHDRHRDARYEPRVVIGDRVRVGNQCHIACVNRVEIGDDVLMGHRVFVTDHFHGRITREELAVPPNSRLVSSKGPVIIERNVWIGEGAGVLPGVTVGEGSVIGANAVVTS